MGRLKTLASGRRVSLVAPSKDQTGTRSTVVLACSSLEAWRTCVIVTDAEPKLCLLPRSVFREAGGPMVMGEQHCLSWNT